MTHQAADKLTLPRKLLLASVAIATIAAPVALGVLNAPPVRAEAAPTAVPLPSVEIVSLKANRSGDKISRTMLSPGGFSEQNATLKSLIEFAYNVKDYQLSGGPSWLDTERYDLEAIVKSPTVEGRPTPVPMEQLQAALQSLLADRFHLSMNQQIKDLPIYALTVAPGGSKLIQAPAPPPAPANVHFKHEQISIEKTLVRDGGEHFDMTGPVSSLARTLSGSLNRQVIDKTGLEGNYEIMLSWNGSADATAAITNAIQSQLGLTLEPQQGPVTTYIIDHVDTPVTD